MQLRSHPLVNASGVGSNSWVEVPLVPKFECPSIKNEVGKVSNFSLAHVPLLQANLSNANLEGAVATGNTSFKGANITGAGMSRFCSMLIFPNALT